MASRLLQPCTTVLRFRQMNATPWYKAADSLALHTCRLFETDNLEEAREGISRVLQPHRLHLHATAIAPRWHMDFLRLGRIGIGTIAFGPATLQVPPLDGYHAIIFCLQGNGVLKAPRQERTIDRSHGLVCSPDEPLSGTFSDDCVQLIVQVERERLSEYTGRRQIRLLPSLDLNRARLQPWRRLLATVITDGEAIALARKQSDVAASYEQLLLQLLLAGQDMDVDPRRRQTVRPAALRRAVGFIREHFAAPLTLADIAEVSRVPERTLNEAFRQFEGVSPMRYLREVRLEAVRAALLRRCSNGSVTSVAMSAGFNHLGRFARDYRGRFGEAPSETMKRR